MGPSRQPQLRLSIDSHLGNEDPDVDMFFDEIIHLSIPTVNEAPSDPRHLEDEKLLRLILDTTIDCVGLNSPSAKLLSQYGKT